MKQSVRGPNSVFTRARYRQYVDELMDDYVSWREACGAVALAYEYITRGRVRELVGANPAP